MALLRLSAERLLLELPHRKQTVRSRPSLSRCSMTDRGGKADLGKVIFENL